MALCKEIVGSSLLERSSLLPNPNSIFLRKQRMLCFESPALVSIKQKRAVRSPAVAAISEDVMKLVIGKPVVKFKVRAAVTVRRKSKEDLKGAIANQWDAISDKIGRSVVLELISTEINPSEPQFFLIWVLFVLSNF